MLRTRMPRLKTPALGRSSSMLFEMRAEDVARSGVIVARTEHVAAFSRASTGQLIDRALRPMSVPVAVPRLTALDLDGDGIAEQVALIVERATTNRIWRSSDFSATWAATNAPTRVAAAARAGDVALDLIGDNSAVNSSYYTQQVFFVGNGTKVVSLYVKKGTAPAASGSLVFLSDFSAPADRYNGVLTFDVNGVPQLNTITGTYLVRDAVKLANGIWIIPLQAPGVIAANNNFVRVVPAQVAGEQGNIYVGGVSGEDNPAMSSLMPTLGAVSARSAELVTFTVDAPPVYPCTLYAELCLPHAAQGRAVDTIVRLGTDDLTSDAKPGIGIYRDAASNIVARSVSGGAHTDASVAMGNAGATTRKTLLAIFDGVNVSISVDGGAAVSVAGAQPAAFNAARLDLPGDALPRWISCKWAAGARTLAQMGA